MRGRSRQRAKLRRGKERTRVQMWSKETERKEEWKI